MNKKLIWTAEEDDTVRKMYLAGASVAHIAATIGRTIHAVTFRVSQNLKIRRPKMQGTTVKNKRVYLDCIPNPFECKQCRELGFDINFYKTI